jgi:hypothetical protein
LSPFKKIPVLGELESEIRRDSAALFAKMIIIASFLNLYGMAREVPE